MYFQRITVALVLLLLGTACSVAEEPRVPELKQVFSNYFMIGAAIGTDRLLQPDDPGLKIVAQQCNSITPENLLKWQSVHPRPGEYDFMPADQFMEYGETNKMFIVGHTLVWHSQVPAWVFLDDLGRPLGRKALLERMREHIHSVVGRYKGRIHGWDVVNEAFEDDGTLRDTAWRRAIGDDYIEKAFQFAHEADPAAELYYNDYSMFKPGKRTATAKLVKQLREAGCKIDGVGLQGHWGLDFPTLGEADEALKDYSLLGVKLMITELDINVLPRPNDGELGAEVSLRRELATGLNPYSEGLPAEVQHALAERYAQVVRLFLKYSDSISRVTFWGIDDGHSWHNNWPVPGRTAHSLLFDRAYQPKPAFWSVVESAND